MDNASNITIIKFHESEHFFHPDIIKVFKDNSTSWPSLLELIWAHFFENFPIYWTTFHIEDIVKRRILNIWHRVLHDHYMDWLKLVHSDSENTKYFCEFWTFKGIKMFKVWWQHPQQMTNLSTIHCLHNKVSIFWKKEETSTGTSSFSRFLNLANIVCWIEGLKHFIIIDILQFPYCLKCLWSVLFDNDFTSQIKCAIYNIVCARTFIIYWWFLW